MALRAPVVVVGLGPVGATAALLLAAHGVETVVVERDREVFPLARAVALDDEALRVLQAAGLGEDARPPMLGAQTVRFRSRTGAPLVVLPPAPSALGHPSLAFFRQPELEAALRARLADAPGVSVRLGEEVEGVSLGGDGAVLALRDVASGARSTLRASHVLACDGARSTVRRALGVRLSGVTSGRRWLVVDTGAPVAPADARPGFAAADFEFCADPRRPWVHGPLPGGLHRWEFVVGPGEAAAALEDPGAAGRLIAARTGGPAPPVLRADVYTFHARLAARWRTGPVLLVGDAAHLAPPFAGQGLSTGLRDAGNLAWKIAAVAQGRAGDALLDTYEAERRPHVLRMTALASLVGAAVQTRRPRAALVRDRVVGALWRSPAVRGWAQEGGWKPPARHARGLRSRDRGDPLAGRLLAQPLLDGVPLDDVLGPGFALLDHGASAGAVPTGRVALVRPDRVVFASAPDTVAGRAELWARLEAALSA